MHSFLNTFALQNVTDDAELAGLVSKARQLVDGVDATTLRSDDLVRKSVAEGFAELRAQLDKLIVERGTREITFDEE